MENQDAIDAAIVGCLADPKEARAGLQEIHFLPFNPVDKRTAITYIENDTGKWIRASKGAPEQILQLAHNKDDIAARVHSIIDKFAERGLRSLAVAMQASQCPTPITNLHLLTFLGADYKHDSYPFSTFSLSCEPNLIPSMLSITGSS